MIGSFLALQFLDILKLSRSSMFFLNFKPDFRKTCQCFQYVSVFHTHHLNIRPNSFLFGILNSSMFISIFRGVSIVGSTPKNHPFSWKSNGDFPLSILIFMGSSSIKIYLGGFVMGYPQWHHPYFWAFPFQKPSNLECSYGFSHGFPLPPPKWNPHQFPMGAPLGSRWRASARRAAEALTAPASAMLLQAAFTASRWAVRPLKRWNPWGKSGDFHGLTWFIMIQL